MTVPTDFNRKVISASKWSALGEIAAKAITPLVLVVLARLLTPDDFGVIAAAAMVISFSQVFWDAGLSKALIQRENDIDEAAIVIFWTNAILGIVIYCFLYFCADLVVRVFDDPRVGMVLQIQGLQLIISSLCSVHTALYQRELNFRVLFWVKLFTTACERPVLSSVTYTVRPSGNDSLPV